MSPLHLALYGALALCGAAVFVTLRRRHTLAQPAVAAIGLIAGIWAIVDGSSVFAWVSIAAAGLGVVLPLQLFRAARRAARRADFSSAATWARRHRRVRGGTRARSVELLWSAARDFYAGNPATGAALEAQLLAQDDAYARSLREAWLALTRQWENLQTASTPDLRARALCRLGEVNAGIEATGLLWRRKMNWAAILRAREAGLTTLAFAGRVAATETLTQLLRLPAPVRSLWRTVALFAAGRPTEARAAADFEAPAAPLRAARDAYLEHPPTPPTLDQSALDVVERYEIEVAAGSILRRQNPLRHPVTAVVLGVLLGVFIWHSVAGNPLNVRSAYAFGALAVDGELPSETWRLLSYGVLHAGVGHLAVNGLAIALLLPVVSALYGQLGGLCLFVGCILSSGVAIALLGSPGITVGASGGALGLLGAVWAASRAHPLLRPSLTGANLSRMLLTLVIVQSAFDLAMPEISFIGHAFGALSGALLGTVWLTITQRSNRSRS